MIFILQSLEVITYALSLEGTSYLILNNTYFEGKEQMLRKFVPGHNSLLQLQKLNSI